MRPKGIGDLQQMYSDQTFRPAGSQDTVRGQFFNSWTLDLNQESAIFL